MRKLLIPLLAALAVVAPLVLAQDRPADKKDGEKKDATKKAEPDEGGQAKPKKAKPERPKIEDAVRRAYAKATEDEDAKLLRFQVIQATDSEGNKAVVCTAEFDNGDLGLYVGGLEADKETFAVVEKKKASAIEDAAHRSANR